MKWTVHLQGGPTRVNHAAARVGNNIYCFGGYYSTEEYKDWDAMPVHVLDTNTLRWSPVVYNDGTDLPFQRYGHTTIAYKCMVYMWGGRNNSIACETLSVFDTTTQTWSNPSVKGSVPYAKDGHSASLIDNNMYIFGGFEYVSDSLTNDIHSLNLDTFYWTRITATGIYPSPRDFHTAITVGPKMYIYGGRSDNSLENFQKGEVYCQNVYCYDTENNHWIPIKAKGVLPVGRRSHSAWYYKGAMYVFGGYNSVTTQHYNTIHKFSIKTNRWNKIRIPGKTPSKRRRQCCVINNDKLYMFGGTSPVNKAAYDFLQDKNDLHILDLKPSLRTLALVSVITHKLDIKRLPQELRLDVQIMSLPNNISQQY